MNSQSHCSYEDTALWEQQILVSAIEGNRLMTSPLVGLADQAAKKQEGEFVVRFADQH